MSIVTRFAPSPTGMLHIGGARTALFNYFFSRKHGGKFLLRIEDTDTERSSRDAVNAIIDGLKWLKIDFDDQVIFQSNNRDRHISVVHDLIAKGHAYECFDKKVNIDGRIQIVKTDKPAIKLRIPTGKITIHDTLHGGITFNNEDIGDIVLLRSNGEPTYMLSVVVDDIDMKVSHIIRGDDHLSNSPKQALIYNALSCTIPSLTHIPLIHNMDGSKLSKRHNATSVIEYEKMGYLPEVMRCYLMKLGWCPSLARLQDSKIHGITDIPAVIDGFMGSNVITQIFDLSDVNKSPAKFDITKLQHLNMLRTKDMSNAELIPYIEQILADEFGITLTDNIRSQAMKALGECKSQVNLQAIAKLARLFLNNFDPALDTDARCIIADNSVIVKELKEFLLSTDYKDFKLAFKDFLTKRDYKFGKVGPILRSMLIGKTSSVNLVTIVDILGAEEVKRRIANY